MRDYTVTEQMRTCDPRFDREHSGMEYQCASVLSNGRGSQRWELVVGAQAPIRVSSTIAVLVSITPSKCAAWTQTGES